MGVQNHLNPSTRNCFQSLERTSLEPIAEGRSGQRSQNSENGSLLIATLAAIAWSLGNLTVTVTIATCCPLGMDNLGGWQQLHSLSFNRQECPPRAISRRRRYR